MFWHIISFRNIASFKIAVLPGDGIGSSVGHYPGASLTLTIRPGGH